MENVKKYCARIDDGSDLDGAAESVERCGGGSVKLRYHEGRIYFESDEETMEAVSSLGCIAGVTELGEDEQRPSRGRYIGLDRNR